MKFGVNIAPSWDSWKLVKRAEELGFDYASFIDSQLINADIFVSMTAAAMKTEKIHLGTGVIIPSNRLAPVAANALASLNAIAPGRIHMGVGTGFTGRRTMGLGPIKLADMFDWIEIVEKLLAGKIVDAHIEGSRRTIQFMNPELELINIKEPVPITVSALGPRGRRLVAERGYAWTNTVGNLDRAETDMKDMKVAWSEAGRDLTDLLATANCGGTVLKKANDWDADYVLAEAGPSSAITLHNLAEEADFGSIGHKPPPELALLVNEYLQVYKGYKPAHARYLANHKNHLMTVRPEEEHLITGAFIRASTLSGTRAEIRDKIRALKEMGYTTFTTHIRTVLPEMVEKWADVIEGI